MLLSHDPLDSLADMGYQLLLVMVFGAVMPVLYPGLAVVFLFRYWVTKHSVLSKSIALPLHSRSSILLVQKLPQLIVLVALPFRVWMLTAIFPDSYLSIYTFFGEVGIDLVDRFLKLTFMPMLWAFLAALFLLESAGIWAIGQCVDMRRVVPEMGN